MPDETLTIAAAGVPRDLVEWLDEEARRQCTSRSTIMRQILTQRALQADNKVEEDRDKEAA